MSTYADQRAHDVFWMTAAERAALDVPAARPLPDTPFYRRMAAGHLTRTGHELNAVLVDGPDGIGRILRACCQ
jgi:hypothetical protein